LSSLEGRIAKLEEAIDALRERVAKVEGVLEQIDLIIAKSLFCCEFNDSVIGI
jgi:uncharacterized coiled-coil protein SlyX